MGFLAAIRINVLLMNYHLQRSVLMNNRLELVVRIVILLMILFALGKEGALVVRVNRIKPNMLVLLKKKLFVKIITVALIVKLMKLAKPPISHVIMVLFLAVLIVFVLRNSLPLTVTTIWVLHFVLMIDVCWDTSKLVVVNVLMVLSLIVSLNSVFILKELIQLFMALLVVRVMVIFAPKTLNVMAF